MLLNIRNVCHITSGSMSWDNDGYEKNAASVQNCNEDPKRQPRGFHYLQPYQNEGNRRTTIGTDSSRGTNMVFR